MLRAKHIMFHDILTPNNCLLFIWNLNLTGLSMFFFPKLGDSLLRGSGPCLPLGYFGCVYSHHSSQGNGEHQRTLSLLASITGPMWTRGLTIFKRLLSSVGHLLPTLASLLPETPSSGREGDEGPGSELASPVSNLILISECPSDTPQSTATAIAVKNDLNPWISLVTPYIHTNSVT